MAQDVGHLPPGEILTGLALSLAAGGDYVPDLDRLRDQPEVYGRIAFDPTISRLFRVLAAEKPGKNRRCTAPAVRTPLVLDLDASMVNSHSEKDAAQPT